MLLANRMKESTKNRHVLPKWAYPRSKVATEALIRELRGTIPTVILRIAGVYDDECHSIPIARQIQRIYEKKLESHLFAGNLRSGASFLHMDDLVEAILLCIEQQRVCRPSSPYCSANRLHSVTILCKRDQPTSFWRRDQNPLCSKMDRKNRFFYREPYPPSDQNRLSNHG